MNDYKALVCVFLEGGMDMFDTIIPTDELIYDQYANNRLRLLQSYIYQGVNSPRNRNNLANLNANLSEHTGFGLPKEMQTFADYINTNKMCVLANVGVLNEPTVKSDFKNNSDKLPRLLFSHSDQRTTWQALKPDGVASGWGGKILDKLVKLYPDSDQSFMGLSISGGNLLVTGEEVQPFNASAEGANKIDPVEIKSILGNKPKYDLARDNLSSFLNNMESDTDNIFEKDATNLLVKSIKDNTKFGNIFKNAPEPNVTYKSVGISQDLKTVAKIIKMNGDLGVNRQIFFVRLIGFDTHSSQRGAMITLQSQLNEAFKSFYEDLNKSGLSDKVTTFTASDFGRTLTSNGSGTDHGWGSHHFIMGDSVIKNSVGEIPMFDTNSDDYTDFRGRLIPKISVDQYGATLAKWMGVSDSELDDIFPNLHKFDTRDLGFLKS